MLSRVLAGRRPLRQTEQSEGPYREACPAAGDLGGDALLSGPPGCPRTMWSCSRCGSGIGPAVSPDAPIALAVLEELTGPDAPVRDR